MQSGRHATATRAWACPIALFLARALVLDEEHPGAGSVPPGLDVISITLDRYGHLMPGSEEKAAGLLDGYLDTQRERAEDQARSAAVAV